MSAIETERFLALLEIVRREGRWLLNSDARLFAAPLDADTISRLEQNEALAERLDAFVARFGRMQDTMGDRLIPSLLRLLAETPGSNLDNLNRAEKLGLLHAVEDWLDARNLRNRLIHEYMAQAEEFAQALSRAHELVGVLVDTYNSINRFAHARIPGKTWPDLLP